MSSFQAPTASPVRSRQHFYARHALRAPYPTHSLTISLNVFSSTTVGEDMLELHLHGGVSVTSSVLEALGSLPDFRMSYKGEFTRRSYENNKMNLLEVEALSDLVNADTDEQRVLALRQLNGDGAEVISGWRQSLISARSNCEALLDFGEEESDVFENPILFRMVEQIENLREDIDMHIRHQSREIVRDGIRVTIVGPTNAGKSSLLNCLLNRDVSIVTDIPGTTRDIIESSVDIDGLAFKFSDSAGIRHSVSDPVEKIGIQLAKDSARSADIRVFVLDIAAFLQQQHTGRDAQTDLLATMKQLSSDDIFPDIIVINKADLIKGSDGLFSRTVTGIPPPVAVEDGGQQDAVGPLVREFFMQHGVDRIESVPMALVSCHDDTGIDILKEQLMQQIGPSNAQDFGAISGKESLVISRARQKKRLVETLDCLSTALKQLKCISEGHGQLELAAEELRMASTALEKLTGTVQVEDVLDALFQEFCIGK